MKIIYEVKTIKLKIKEHITKEETTIITTPKILIIIKTKIIIII